MFKRGSLSFGEDKKGEALKEEFVALPIGDETKRKVLRENNVDFLKLE